MVLRVHMNKHGDLPVTEWVHKSTNEATEYMRYAAQRIMFMHADNIEGPCKECHVIDDCFNITHSTGSTPLPLQHETTQHDSDG